MIRFFDLAARAFQRVGFVMRFFWARLRLSQRLEMEGFVFLEPGVVFRIRGNGRITIRNGAYIKTGAILEAQENGHLILDKGCNIGHYAWIGSTSKVYIGEKTGIGQGATVFDVLHESKKTRFFQDQGYLDGEIHIAADAFIGAKATVGPDLRIARGVIVGANSVVTGTIDREYGVYVGMPARYIRDRD